ncbi:MAG: hypothetical protein AB1416_09625 [Actinomycetota bacterium]
MSDESPSPTPQDPPDCHRCGARTFATTRTMRTHDISSGRAVPKDTVYPVWRCLRCGAESPRT